MSHHIDGRNRRGVRQRRAGVGRRHRSQAGDADAIAPSVGAASRARSGVGAALCNDTPSGRHGWDVFPYLGRGDRPKSGCLPAGCGVGSARSAANEGNGRAVMVVIRLADAETPVCRYCKQRIHHGQARWAGDADGHPWHYRCAEVAGKTNSPERWLVRRYGLEWLYGEFDTPSGTDHARRSTRQHGS